DYYCEVYDSRTKILF
nr:immunoglobulin light chain junction region [Macaca mulatta]